MALVDPTSARPESEFRFSLSLDSLKISLKVRMFELNDDFRLASVDLRKIYQDLK